MSTHVWRPKQQDGWDVVCAAITSTDNRCDDNVPSSMDVIVGGKVVESYEMTLKLCPIPKQ